MNLLEFTKFTEKEFKNLKILIVGTGITAKSFVRFCNKLENTPTIVDLYGNPFELKNAKYYIKSLKSFYENKTNKYDFVFISPGINPENEIVKFLKENENVFLSDLDIFEILRSQNLFVPKNQKIIMITGSNGKSTTTKLLTKVMNDNGKKAIACGNIGVPILDVILSENNYEYFVVEVSSFQLFWSNLVKADYSVWLNFSEDHLDYHGSRLEYFKAKNKILNSVNNFVNISIYTDEENNLNKDGIYFFSNNIENSLNNFYFHNNDLEVCLKNEKYNKTLNLPLDLVKNKGMLENILAVFSLCIFLKLDFVKVRESIINFRTDLHKFEKFFDTNNYIFYDDSKATNPHAVNNAFSSLDNIIWITGGDLKGGNVESIYKDNLNKIKFIYIFGKDSMKIYKTLKSVGLKEFYLVIPAETINKNEMKTISGLREEEFVIISDDYKNNVFKILIENFYKKIFKKNNFEKINVLFSPGGSSLDFFKNYEERGEFFQKTVEKIFKK